MNDDEWKVFFGVIFLKIVVVDVQKVEGGSIRYKIEVLSIYEII